MKKIILALCLFSLSGCAKTEPLDKAQYLDIIHNFNYGELATNKTDFYHACFDRNRADVIPEINELYRKRLESERDSLPDYFSVNDGQVWLSGIFMDIAKDYSAIHKEEFRVNASPICSASYDLIKDAFEEVARK